jgi:uncharacterized protein YgiB involved in biofilm formation
MSLIRISIEVVQSRAERIRSGQAAQSAHGVGAAPVARCRRASTRITLVLIGAASLQACGDAPQETVQRDLYDNRAKCVQDWGDEKKCEPISEGRNRGYYYGPAYNWGRSGYAPGTSGADSSGAAVPKGSNAVGSHRVARSGFGSTSSAHSSGS